MQLTAAVYVVVMLIVNEVFVKFTIMKLIYIYLRYLLSIQPSE